MNNKERVRKNRQKRIRKKIHGTEKIPRMAVSRSLNNIYGQLIDDVKGKVIISFSSLKAEKGEKQKKMDKSRTVGKILAQKAKEKGIKKIVFDRRGNKYHGRIKALADSAREEGLEF